MCLIELFLQFRDKDSFYSDVKNLWGGGREVGRFVFILSVQSGLLQTQAAICVFLGFAAKTPKLLSALSLPG